MYPHTKEDQALGQVLSAKTKGHFKILHLNFKFLNFSNNQAFDQLGTCSLWAEIGL